MTSERSPTGSPENQESSSKKDKVPGGRISTQIHRRKKAKAVHPLTDEWEATQPDPPANLKTPSDQMKKNG